jgi:hypothetical protein
MVILQVLPDRNDEWNGAYPFLELLEFSPP